MKSLITPSILALLAAATPARAQDTPVLEQPAAHHVVWDSPSEDMHGSMPIGNGDFAANFWVEPSGDLVFYLSKSDSRFPAFWGRNFDGTPDQCQGSVTLIALQRMLMQCDGDTIRLAPAWPKDWNANFKLHAPKNTIVEGRVENGKVTDLKVTPESRHKDVVIGAE